MFQHSIQLAEIIFAATNCNNDTTLFHVDGVMMILDRIGWFTHGGSTWTSNARGRNESGPANLELCPEHCEQLQRVQSTLVVLVPPLHLIVLLSSFANIFVSTFH